MKTGILFFGWWFVRNWRGTSNNRLTWAINGEENLTPEDLLLSKKYDAINWRNSTQCVIPAHYHGLHPLFGGVNHRKIKLRHNFPPARAGTKLRHIITPFKSHSRNWVGGKTHEKKKTKPPSLLHVEHVDDEKREPLAAMWYINGKMLICGSHIGCFCASADLGERDSTPSSSS